MQSHSNESIERHTLTVLTSEAPPELRAKPRLFGLGRVFATPAAAAAMTAAGFDPLVLMWRHATGDFGDVQQEDIDANHTSIADGSRIYSRYLVGLDLAVWLVTEWDRSASEFSLESEN